MQTYIQLKNLLSFLTSLNNTWDNPGQLIKLIGKDKQIEPSHISGFNGNWEEKYFFLLIFFFHNLKGL